MAHEVEAMAYVGETPWHGLGKRLAVAPTTTEEAIKLSGLDWTIALEAMQLLDGTKVPDRCAVVRQTDRAVLGVVGKDWEPIQNATAFSPVDPFLAAGEATIETAGSLRGGKRVWMLARITRPDAVIVPGADDRVAKYVLCAVGHDGTMSFQMRTTPVRVVCQNTLSLATDTKGGDVIKLNHYRGASVSIGDIRAVIDAIDAKIERTADLYRALAGVKVKSRAQLKAYLDSVFPPPPPKVDGEALLAGLLGKPANLSGGSLSDHGTADAETLTRIQAEVAEMFEHGRGNDLPGVRGTAWAAYNAVTEYKTWQSGRTADTRLDSLWFRNQDAGEKALAAAQSTFLAA